MYRRLVIAAALALGTTGCHMCEEWRELSPSGDDLKAEDMSRLRARTNSRGWEYCPVVFPPLMPLFFSQEYSAIAGRGDRPVYSLQVEYGTVASLLHWQLREAVYTSQGDNVEYRTRMHLLGGALQQSTVTYAGGKEDTDFSILGGLFGTHLRSGKRWTQFLWLDLYHDD